MKLFKKKSDDLITTVAESALDSHSIGAASIIIIGSTLAFISFYFYKKFRPIKTKKTKENIIIHTTKLDN